MNKKEESKKEKRELKWEWEREIDKIENIVFNHVKNKFCCAYFHWMNKQEWIILQQHIIIYIFGYGNKSRLKEKRKEGKKEEGRSYYY